MLSPTSPLRGKHYHPHFTDGKAEAEWLNNLPKGSERTGTGANSRRWSTLCLNHSLSNSSSGVNIVGAGQSSWQNFTKPLEIPYLLF